jgi:hypothetical protein
MRVAITRGIDAFGKAGYSTRALGSIEAAATRVVTG